MQSPIGPLTVVEKAQAIVRLEWGSEAPSEAQSDLLRAAKDQLDAYFAGALKIFDLPLAPKGSELQQAVFREMSAIPYGQTRTYGQIARTLGTFGQPVGQACGANPIPVIIPCHRVLSTNGLGGYSGAGGLETKIKLLQMEGGYPFLV